MRKKILRWTGLSWHQRWHMLFVLLVALIALFPYLERNVLFGDDDTPLLVLHTMITLAIIRCLGLQLNHWWLIALGLLIIVLRLMPLGPLVELLRVVSTIALYVYLLCTIMEYIKHQHHIGTEELYAVGCLYLMLGMLWTVLYEGLLLFYPLAFLSNGQPFEPSWGDLFYFSFTTLTTLGYGDILPAIPQARSLAVLEVITGLLFVAVMFAGAVNLHISWRSTTRD